MLQGSSKLLRQAAGRSVRASYRYGRRYIAARASAEKVPLPELLAVAKKAAECGAEVRFHAGTCLLLVLVSANVNGQSWTAYPHGRAMHHESMRTLTYMFMDGTTIYMDCVTAAPATAISTCITTCSGTVVSLCIVDNRCACTYRSAFAHACSFVVLRTHTWHAGCPGCIGQASVHHIQGCNRLGD